MADPFSQSVALITGASSGLGEQFARQLAVRGCTLILTARSEAKLDALAGELTAAHGAQVRVVPCDLAEPGAGAALCGRVDELGLDVDHVINNAGRATATSFATADPAQEVALVRLNCEAPVAIACHYVPRLIAKGRGGLLNVASIAALMPIAGMATYGGTKAFVASWSRAVAEELRDTGVRCLTLCPGAVSTAFQEAARYELGSVEKFAELPPARVVEVALSDYAAGKGLSSPGVVNTVGRWAIGATPSGLVARITANVLRQRWQR